MDGRAAASIQRFFRLRVSLREPPETNRILGDPAAFPPVRLSPRLEKTCLAKGETMKLLTADIRNRLLRNGRVRQQCEQAGESEPDFLPVVKLFTPDGGCTWLLTEINPEDPDIAFGLCDLGFGCPELGSVSLSELESVRGQLGLPVERDLYFTATKTLSAYADEARAHGAITA